MRELRSPPAQVSDLYLRLEIVVSARPPTRASCSGNRMTLTGTASTCTRPGWPPFSCGYERSKPRGDAWSRGLLGLALGCAYLLLIVVGGGCGNVKVVSDAGPDVGTDAGSDTGSDAGPDAEPDAEPDAGPDAGSDAPIQCSADCGSENPCICTIICTGTELNGLEAHCYDDGKCVCYVNGLETLGICTSDAGLIECSAWICCMDFIDPGPDGGS